MLYPAENVRRDFRQSDHAKSWCDRLTLAALAAAACLAAGTGGAARAELRPRDRSHFIVGFRDGGFAVESLNEVELAGDDVRQDGFVAGN
jgi:hypothetical protein